MKATAAILRQTGVLPPYAESTPLVIEEIDVDAPGPGEVLVKIAAAGLCHSDLSVIDGNRPRPMPMALGHEASGIIEDVGVGVTRFSPGDHVVMVFVPSCGLCGFCARGRPALCEPGALSNAAGSLLSGTRRIHQQGEIINHHLGVSAFSTYATLSQHSVIKIDPEFDLNTAALFGCAVLTGVGAVVNTAGLPPGASAAVIGLGGVGLCALLGAQLAGARQILAIDLSEEKLAFARELGATHTVNAGNPNAVEQIRDLTGGGVEYAFEMAGSVPALELAYNITARGGTTVTSGLPHPERKLSIQAVSIVAEERTLKGSYIGTSVPSVDLPRYLSLYEQGKLPVDRLLTHTLALEEINLGFDRLASGEAIRQVVVL